MDSSLPKGGFKIKCCFVNVDGCAHAYVLYKALLQVKIDDLPYLSLTVVNRTGGDRQLWCLNSDGSLESRCGAFAEVAEGDEGKLQVTKQ